MNIGVTRPPNNKQLKDSAWEILIGSQKGRQFLPSQRDKDTKSVPDSMMVWSQSWPSGNTRFLLLLDWNRVKELEPVYGNLRDLCFGTGVKKLVEHLSLEVPCKDNLSQATTLYVKE